MVRSNIYTKCSTRFGVSLVFWFCGSRYKHGRPSLSKPSWTCLPVAFSSEIYSAVNLSVPYSRRHTSVDFRRWIACDRSHFVARRYRRRHSRVSHMRSSSEMGDSSEVFAEAVGRDSHVRTSARSWSYLDCCSAVKAGAAAGLQPGTGSAKGPIADMLKPKIQSVNDRLYTEITDLDFGSPLNCGVVGSHQHRITFWEAWRSLHA
jgi:hypothetical protein